MLSILEILLVVGVIIVLLLIIHIRLQRILYRKRIIALEQRLLISQMNPHFVFNALTAIQSYIFRNDAYTAGKYLSSFSKLVRLVLENSRQETIPIAKELETIKYYLQLQELRFEGKFEYTISVDSDLDTQRLKIPPMLAQPFIENAIEHGIIHLSSKGKIEIRYQLNGSNLFLEVEDNGIGIDYAMLLSQHKWKEHQSLATKISKERIKNYKKNQKQEIEMDIMDLKNESSQETRGTLIRFKLPISTI